MRVVDLKSFVVDLKKLDLLICVSAKIIQYNRISNKNSTAVVGLLAVVGKHALYGVHGVAEGCVARPRSSQSTTYTVATTTTTCTTTTSSAASLCVQF